jgi:hypothetical protein
MRWLIALFHAIMHKFIGTAPSWYDDPKVEYSYDELQRMQRGKNGVL